MRIATAEDLEAILSLDDALWVATGCPLDTVRADRTFLSLLDIDDNRRIMCYEVRTAIRWLLSVLRDRSGIQTGSDSIAASAVDAESEDGARIVTALEKLVAHNHSGSTVSLAEVRAVETDVAERPVSESGVVLPSAPEDPQVQAFLSDVVATLGGAEHPSGTRGVDQEALAAVGRQSAAYLAWREERAADPAILPVGEATDEAYALLARLEPKIDQYFALCAALEIDERIVKRLKSSEEELALLDPEDRGSLTRVMTRSPIAAPAPDAALPLHRGINPHYERDLAAFVGKVVSPLLGDEAADAESITLEEWEKLRSAFAAHRRWREREPEHQLGRLAEATLREYAAPRYEEAVAALIEHSRATSFDLENLRLVEKLLLFQKHLVEFVNNFVSFPALYDPNGRAIFEMGSLVMDGRHFNLAVRVLDRARHRAVAQRSSMFVLYIAVRQRSGGQPSATERQAPAAGSIETFELAVPVTSGRMRHLTVGKRGIFCDVDGREYDAEVTEILANPISVGEAIDAPFKRIGNLVTTKIESLTAEAQSRLDEATLGSVAAPGTAAAPGVGATTGALAGGGLIAGSGVAIAAVGSMFTYLAGTIANLSVWRVLIGVGGALAAVIVPMTVLAFIKLRRRELSSILEGSGWAINARMRLTRAQCREFTQTPHLPPGSVRLRKRRWLWIVMPLVVVAVGALTYWVLIPLFGSR